MIEFVKNFWCQKVLPLVYTDALSYYEVLSKFVAKLNEVVNNVNNLNENTVFTVNNVKPVNGNVTIDASSFEGFVSGVNGKKPDEGGEVTLTAEDVGAVPDTTVVVSSVNGIAPTDGNVNVGTVKSVNGSAPDASGNVNLPKVSGVTSVDGVGADSSGNVQLNAVKTVNGIAPADGNVNVGTVKNVNGYTPDENGIIPGVSAVSMFSYISTWNTAKDIYDFAINADNSKKLFYAGIWHENNYPWWNAELFGTGDFILTILNLASTHQPEIILRSLERGDIFILHREGESPNNTYIWRPNYGANVKTINNVAADGNGNISLAANNVGAIPSTENAVTFSNVNANGLYPKLVSITTPTAIINEDWGRFVFLSNDVTSITLNSETANALSDSWHSIIMNGGSKNINVTMSAWLIDLDNGTNGMGNAFTLGAGKYIEIQRFSTAGFMLRGSFTRP